MPVASGRLVKRGDLLVTSESVVGLERLAPRCGRGFRLLLDRVEFVIHLLVTPVELSPEKIRIRLWGIS